MNILVISSNLIGDSVLSTGVIKHFNDLYPNTRFTFVIGPTASQIYRHYPNCDNIFVVKKIKYNLHWFIIWKKCLFKKWDIIIDFRSSLIAYILYCKKRFIFKRSNNAHQIKQLGDFFKIQNIPFPIIFNSSKEKQYVEEKLNSKNIYIVLAPGGNWAPKIWPAEYFNQLIKHLLNKYNNKLYIILVGSKKEKEKYKNLVIKSINNEKIIDLMGFNLTQTCAFMKKSHLFIGNDSGLMHLAVAAKIPTIGLFGPTNDKIYSPIGINSYTIRTKETLENFKSMNITNNKTYMQSLKVSKVLELIEEKKLI